MKVLGNPEMAALLTSLAKSMNLNAPPEMVHRSTKNIKNTRRGLYHITPEFPEEICQASFRGLSPRFRQPLLFIVPAFEFKHGEGLFKSCNFFFNSYLAGFKYFFSLGIS